MKCKCGCGQEITKDGYGVNYLRGHWNKEKRKPVVWIGGYAYIHCPTHPNAWTRKGYIKRCRLIMSEKLGRPFEPWEVVHHINGDKTDDRVENLIVTSKAQHIGQHAHERRYLPDKVCPVCGKSFYKGTHHYTSIYCSKKCANGGENNAMYGNHDQRYTKLTSDQVREIRELYPVLSQAKIAKKIGISQTQISRIIRNVNWK